MEEREDAKDQRSFGLQTPESAAAYNVKGRVNRTK